MDFEDFYRDHHASVLRLCFLVTLDVEAAADATQEAMLRTWEQWAHLGDETPGAWVRTVALNLCRSRWRQVQRGLRLAARLYTVPSRAEIRDLDLLEALRRLPARQREAVVLYYLADQSVEDCAGLMAVSAGAVKRHLSRAREHLARDQAIRPLEGTT